MARFRLPLFQILTLGLMLIFLLLVLRPDWVREVLDSLRTPIVKEVEIRQETAPALLPNQGPVSYSAAVQRAAPAVVNIHTAKVVTERPRIYLMIRCFNVSLATPYAAHHDSAYKPVWDQV